ncbi:MAG: hypothetical protein RQ758_09095 [Methanomicrobiaceae archaeon]|nr:hypothetical protein [Methanomicrobiaceae archaeon]
MPGVYLTGCEQWPSINAAIRVWSVQGRGDGDERGASLMRDRNDGSVGIRKESRINTTIFTS